MSFVNPLTIRVPYSVEKVPFDDPLKSLEHFPGCEFADKEEGFIASLQKNLFNPSTFEQALRQDERYEEVNSTSARKLYKPLYNGRERAMANSQFVQQYLTEQRKMLSENRPLHYNICDCDKKREAAAKAKELERRRAQALSISMGKEEEVLPDLFLQTKPSVPQQPIVVEAVTAKAVEKGLLVKGQAEITEMDVRMATLNRVDILPIMLPVMSDKPGQCTKGKEQIQDDDKKEEAKMEVEVEETKKAEDEETKKAEDEGTKKDEDEGTTKDEDEGTKKDEDEGTTRAEDEGTKKDEDEGTKKAEDEGTKKDEDEGTKKDEDEGTKKDDAIGEENDKDKSLDPISLDHLLDQDLALSESDPPNTPEASRMEDVADNDAEAETQVVVVEAFRSQLQDENSEELDYEEDELLLDV